MDFLIQNISHEMTKHFDGIPKRVHTDISNLSLSFDDSMNFEINKKVETDSK